jgi:hypothetical protein
VALAVWAFRRLEAGMRAGIVAAGEAAAVPAEILDAVEAGLLTFVEAGAAAAGRNGIDRLARLARRCTEADLVWPAEVLQEVVEQLESYAIHDARFDPARLGGLLGEMVVRIDALRSDTGTLPALLVRGSAADRPAELEAGEYWGLGCGVRAGRGGAEVAAYVYDRKSGNVLALVQEVAEDGPEPRPFAELGQRIAVRGLAGATFAAAGAGVLQMPGGKRTARYTLQPPGVRHNDHRRPTLLAQDRFAWEEIDPPVRCDSFAELEERLALLPPAALRPRRVAEDFHVLRIAEVVDVRFDRAAHAVQALLADRHGRRALLVHPFTSRGAPGFETLLGRLTGGPGKLCFVSGQVSRAASGLVVRPVCLVWQDGAKRTAVQPWVERGGSSQTEPMGELAVPAEDAATGYLAQLERELGELLVVGLLRADGAVARAWGELARRGEVVGFGRLAARVQELAGRLEHKAHTLSWDAVGAARLVLELEAFVRLARDVGA